MEDQKSFMETNQVVALVCKISLHDTYMWPVWSTDIENEASAKPTKLLYSSKKGDLELISLLTKKKYLIPLNHREASTEEISSL